MGTGSPEFESAELNSPELECAEGGSLAELVAVSCELGSVGEKPSAAAAAGWPKPGRQGYEPGAYGQPSGAAPPNGNPAARSAERRTEGGSDRDETGTVPRALVTHR